MFKGTSVIKRNGGGKDGRSGCKGRRSIQEKDGFHRMGSQTQASEKMKRNKKNIERRE